MNFIITQACNKGCPYCFAAQSRKEHIQAMSFEQFKAYVDKTPGHIKLLGGEPTQHPQFLEFLDYLYKLHRPTTIISNFLFNEDIKKGILSRLEKGYSLSFLVNSTDLDIKGRDTIWKENYNEIYTLLYSMDKEREISCGITLYEKNSTDYYLSYLDFLKSITPGIEGLRISLNFPGNDEDKEPNSIIDNKTAGEKILAVCKWAIDNLILPHIDCCLFPCLFNNREEFKFISNFASRVKWYCGESAPADIFPDGTVSYCYPLKDTLKLNFEDYKFSGEAQEALRATYAIAQNKITLSPRCQNCSFFKCGICKGPCLGFYDLKKVDIPKWY